MDTATLEGALVFETVIFFGLLEVLKKHRAIFGRNRINI